MPLTCCDFSRTVRISFFGTRFLILDAPRCPPRPPKVLGTKKPPVT